MVKLLFGIKMSIRDLSVMDRLNPDAVEFYTTQDDLMNHFDEMKNIAKQINLPKAVHVPIYVDGTPFCLRKHRNLVERCVELGELIVVHPDTGEGEKHDDLLDTFISSLSFFEDHDIRVAIENLPGWYEYRDLKVKHTIGMDIDDFKEIFRNWPRCGLCFDVCHAAMLGQDIESWFMELGKKIIHMHFSDSKNGIEGMQIGKGDVRWKNVFVWAKRYCSGRIMVIPEIADGHKNGGLGFKIALERLRKLY